MTCYLSELIDRLGGTKKSRLGEKFALNSRYLIGKRSDPKRIKSRLSYERRYINTFGTLKSFEKHKQADKCYERRREHSAFHPAAPDLISTKCHHSRCKENSIWKTAAFSGTMSWVWEKFPTWRLVVLGTRDSRSAMGLFSFVTMACIPLAVGSTLMSITNRETDAFTLVKQRGVAEMHAKLMVRS
jgi:hypothetical protein